MDLFETKEEQEARLSRIAKKIGYGSFEDIPRFKIAYWFASSEGIWQSHRDSTMRFFNNHPLKSDVTVSGFKLCVPFSPDDLDLRGGSLELCIANMETEVRIPNEFLGDYVVNAWHPTVFMLPRPYPISSLTAWTVKVHACLRNESPGANIPVACRLHLIGTIKTQC